jgi:polysaccharide biosynthesis transport protein
MDRGDNYLAGNGPGPVELAQHYRLAGTKPPSQLLEYWCAVRSRIPMVALLALAGALAGFGVALLQHPLFRARTVLDIRSLNENVLSGRNDNRVGAAEGLPESYLQTEIKILQSDAVLKRALDRMPKQNVKPDEERSLSLFSGLVRVPEPKLAPLAALVADASRRIKIRALGNTRIVEILCDARDGQIAALMCNNLAQAYSDNNLESRQKSTSDTQVWLSSQLENVRKRLAESESQLKDSARETSLLFSSNVDNPAQEKLRQLQAEMSRVQAERIAKQSEYEVVLTSGPDALPIALDAGPIREYRLRLNELKTQLLEMSATMTPEHYRVRQLQAQIAEVKAALDKERKDLISRLRTDYDATRQRERMLTEAYNQQAAALSEHGDRAVRHDMLERDVDSTRKLYEALLQRVEEVNLANAMKASSINIVDKATAPTVPYSPSWPSSTGIGLFAGACLGLGIAILSSNSDRTLRDPGEAHIQFQIRELGVIPTARRRTARLLLGRFLPELNRSQQSLPGGVVRRDQMVELTTWRRDQPEMAEAFCGAMNSLLLSRVGDRRAHAVVLTSPDIGDGKTSVAANLAIALARANRSVVLVDGDMRRPRLHSIFNLDTRVSLDSLLRGGDPMGRLPLKELVVSTEIEGLFVLPTAPVKDGSVSALLHSARLPLLVQRLRDAFDIVLIDTPPMRLSDARVFGSIVDGALLVFRSGKTTRDAAFAAQDCLMQDGIRVLGAILNDWNSGRSRTYSRYLRQYSYEQS